MSLSSSAGWAIAPVAVLEVGGTHASCRWVDTNSWTTGAEAGRVALPPAADADTLLDLLVECARSLGPVDAAVLAVAIPGPFVYSAGIGAFLDVGKFDSLNGVNVGDALQQRLHPARVAFANDAACFGLGSWLRTAPPCRRLVAITLGTGIGSAFISDGRVITSGPTVPPGGQAHLLRIGEQALEDVVSRRAILANYRRGGGPDHHDVVDIAAAANAGDVVARNSITVAITALAQTLTPWLETFAAERVVIGGAMSRSWNLLEPALRAGFGELAVEVVRAIDPDADTAVGAACSAVAGGGVGGGGGGGRS